MEKKWLAKRIVLVLVLVILGLILAGISSLFIIYRNEIKTISSINKIDEYGMYEMTYYGDYNFDKLLTIGAKNGKDIADFIVQNLSKSYVGDDFLEQGLIGGGCTSFAVRNDRNQIIYGRNFDFRYSPSILVHTNPKGGYSSVSTVNLLCLGFNEFNLPKNVNENGFSLTQSILTLSTPFIPFDGMNEKGVAISLLSVPEGEGDFDSNKISLNTTTAIRLVLDYAASVEEAVAMLSKYNIHFSEDVPCHFFIADASGTSVIVEYYEKEMHVIESPANYQIASNFIAYNNLNIGTGQERYKTVEEEIVNRGHILTDEAALNLLGKVGDRDENGDKLQWSVLYNLTDLDGEIFAHRKVSDRTYFTLNH